MNCTIRLFSVSCCLGREPCYLLQNDNSSPSSPFLPHLLLPLSEILHLFSLSLHFPLPATPLLLLVLFHIALSYSMTNSALKSSATSSRLLGIEISLYSCPLHMHSLPGYQNPTPEWCISYRWWTFIDTSLSPRVHSSHRPSLLVVYILWAWMNV